MRLALADIITVILLATGTSEQMRGRTAATDSLVDVVLRVGHVTLSILVQVVAGHLLVPLRMQQLHVQHHLVVVLRFWVVGNDRQLEAVLQRHAVVFADGKEILAHRHLRAPKYQTALDSLSNRCAIYTETGQTVTVVGPIHGRLYYY